MLLTRLILSWILQYLMSFPKYPAPEILWRGENFSFLKKVFICAGCGEDLKTWALRLKNQKANKVNPTFVVLAISWLHKVSWFMIFEHLGLEQELGSVKASNYLRKGRDTKCLVQSNPFADNGCHHECNWAGPDYSASEDKRLFLFLFVPESVAAQWKL